MKKAPLKTEDVDSVASSLVRHSHYLAIQIQSDKKTEEKTCRGLKNKHKQQNNERLSVNTCPA